MAENIEAINTLQAARKTLVEERRTLSVAMALGYRRRRTDDAHTNGMRESFIGIQNTIEAIDRAIADERLLETEPAEMSAVLEIVTDGSIVAAGCVPRPGNVLQNLPRHAWRLAMFTAMRNASLRDGRLAEHLIS